ncbi:MAG: TIGR02206 family membrane protein [Clostridia bacterium]|nr:TIGR02206 family membrane protein [Clostridia bacterium]
MQGAAVLIAALQGIVMRRVILLRRCGYRAAAGRLYRLCALTLAALTLGAMLAQEIILWRAGLLTWRTGLPLHLCSAAGLLLPVMLLTGSRAAWHVTLFLGLPGGVLATVFPSILTTPYPYLTRLSFHVLHGCLAAAPLLPLCMGLRPSPLGALQAGAFLTVLAMIAAAVNHLTGSNYLFLNLPAPGTPLALLARGGVNAYRLHLAGIAAAVLAAEGIAVAVLTRRNG